MSTIVSKAQDFKASAKSYGKYKLHKKASTLGANVTLNATGVTETIFEIPFPSYPNFGRSYIDYIYTPPQTGAAATAHRLFAGALTHMQSIQLITNARQYPVDLQDVHKYTKLVWLAETSVEQFKELKGVYPDVTYTTADQRVRAFTAFADAAHKTVILHKAKMTAQQTCMLQPNRCKKDRVLIDQIAGTGADVAVAGTINAVIASTNARILGQTCKLSYDASYLNGMRPIIANANNQHKPSIDEWEPTWLISSVTNGNAAGTAAVGTPAAGTAYAAANGTAATAKPVLNVRLPLSMLYNTLLAMDKDLYINEQVQLRILWNADQKIRYECTDVLDPATGAAAGAGAGAISGLYLYLALQQERDIQEGLKALYDSGSFSMVIPHVVVNNQLFTAANSTSRQLTLKYGPQHGQKLIKVYHGLFHGTETGLTAYNHSNAMDYDGDDLLVGAGNAPKCKTFYSVLDGNQIQSFTINVNKHEDKVLMKRLVKGSILDLNDDIYRMNWMYIEDFSDSEGPLCECKDDIVVRGLDLNQEHTYEFYATTSFDGIALADIRHYTFAITQRTLKVENGQLMVV